MRRYIFIFLLLFFSFHNFVKADTNTTNLNPWIDLSTATRASNCVCPSGYSSYPSYQLDRNNDYNTSGLAEVHRDQDVCNDNSYGYTELEIHYHVNNNGSGVSHVSDILHRIDYACIPSCPPSQSRDDNGTCVPDTSCPTGEVWDIGSEQCICENGYPKIDGQCQVPHCPQSDPSYPTFTLVSENSNQSECEQSAGGASFTLASYPEQGLNCCYVDPNSNPDPNDNNETECPTNYFKIGDDCYPIDPNDNNETDNNNNNNNNNSNNGGGNDDNDSGDPFDCPVDYYYSIVTEKCEPFYDDNNTNDNSSNGGSGGGNDGSATSENNNNDSNVSSNDSNSSDMNLSKVEDLLSDINATINFDSSKSLKDIAKSFNNFDKRVSQALQGYQQNYEALQAVISGTKIPRSRMHGGCQIAVTVFNKRIDLAQGFIRAAPVMRPVVMLFLNIYFTLLLLRVIIWAYRDVSEKILILFH